MSLLTAFSSFSYIRVRWAFAPNGLLNPCAWCWGAGQRPIVVLVLVLVLVVVLVLTAGVRPTHPRTDPPATHPRPTRDPPENVYSKKERSR